jgi:hypothetical protein
MRPALLIAFGLIACEGGAALPPAEAPAAPVAPAASEAGPTKAEPSSNAKTDALGGGKRVNPLGGHRLFWSKSGQRLAVVEDTPCGPPGPQSTCAKELSRLRIVDLVAGRKDTVLEAATVFGFRADGETLVIRRGDAELVDWSTKTQSGRTSDFDSSTRGLSFVCLSPDDVHFVAVDVQGAVTWRSRSSSEGVALTIPSSAKSAPSDCTFSPSGKAFAISNEGSIAVFAAGKETPLRSMRMPGVGKIAWSTDERLVTFSVPDVLRADGSGLFYVWDPERDHAQVYAGSVAADVDPRRRQILTRGGCAWKRVAFDGQLIGADKPSSDGCAHVHEHEVAISPNGTFAAAVEGEWGGSSLVLRPLQ